MHGAATRRRSRRYAKKRKSFFARLSALIPSTAMAATLDSGPAMAERAKQQQRTAASRIRYLVVLICSFVMAGPLNMTEAGTSDMWTSGLLAYAGVNSNGRECVAYRDVIPPATDEPADVHAQAFAMASYGVNSGPLPGKFPLSGPGADTGAPHGWTDTNRPAGAPGTGGGNVDAHGTGMFAGHAGTALTSAINDATGNIMTADAHGIFGPHGGGTSNPPGTWGQNPGGSGNFPADEKFSPGNFTYDGPFAPTGSPGGQGRGDGNCCAGFDTPLAFSPHFSHTALLDSDIPQGDDTTNNLPGAADILRSSTVPEPASCVLLALGLAGLGWSRRKQA